MDALPLPGESFQNTTVIASVWLNDEVGSYLLLLLEREPPYYSLYTFDTDLTHSESYPNIVPAVEAYQENGGDY